MAAENNITLADNLGEVKSIDFVNIFGNSIEDLLKLIGVTRRLELDTDATIQTYKWTKTMAANQVGEGELIPLSKAERKKADKYTVPFNKYRKVTTAEAIRRHGLSLAVDEADEKILEEIQDSIKTKFFTFLQTAPTKQNAVGFQSALSLGWAKSKTFFSGNVQIISFVNSMDVAKYLGDAPIQSGATSEYGFTILQGFLNQVVIAFDEVPEGKVYSTAVRNLVFASQNVAGNDLATAFNLTTDDTGLIGVTHSVATNNATIETLVFEGSTLFAELLNGVVETTITQPVTTTTTTVAPTTTTTTTSGSK